jgi:hypothetical protein
MASGLMQNPAVAEFIKDNLFGAETRRLLVGDTVVPVIVVNEAFEQAKTEGDDLTVTGNGTKTLLTVPDGEAWLVHAASVVKTGGTFDMDYVALITAAGEAVMLSYRATPSDDDWCLETGQCPFPMSEGHKFCVVVSGHSVNGVLSARLLVSKRKI